jgi:PPM family protein phosphatase
VALLTIGAFARASRLSPKALRLYDELGLLPPAHVDPSSGYRFYAPEQLDRARLVAWLRRLGMPLARIRDVCDLEAGQAADAVAAYWAAAEADLASRRNLASFLISYLSGGEPAMPVSSLAIRYAARSDIGRVRDRNQDTAYASSRLLAVADGMGHAGDQASAAVIEALKPLETALPAGDLLNALSDAVRSADAALRDLRPGDDEGMGTGTTLTAMLLTGSQLALVHIGDTRAYLLRDGELFQITHDHSVVQSLLDAGKITEAEAASHPQRALLLRALDGRASADPDLSLHDARAGDRYLLCSDGLTAVVPVSAIEETLLSHPDPERAVAALIATANAAGGPDNVACVVADVIPT